MKAAFVFCLVVVTALAGCLQSGGGDDLDDGASPRDPSRLPLNLNLDASNCNVVSVTAMVEPAIAYQSLPPGYRARDARGLFDTGADSGKIPVFVAAVDCQEGVNDLNDSGYQMGLIAVFVEAPVIDGYESEGNHDFYIHHLYTDHEIFLNTLEGLRWNHGWGMVEQESMLNDTPETETGVPAVDKSRSFTAQIHDETGLVATLTAASPVEVQSDAPQGGFRDWTINFWHQNDAGVGRMATTFTSDAALGYGACELREQSPPFQAIGQDDCPQGVRDDMEEHLPPTFPPSLDTIGEATISSVFQDMTLDSQVVWMPGKVAQ